MKHKTTTQLIGDEFVVTRSLSRYDPPGTSVTSEIRVSHAHSDVGISGWISLRRTRFTSEDLEDETWVPLSKAKLRKEVRDAEKDLAPIKKLIMVLEEWVEDTEAAIDTFRE